MKAFLHGVIGLIIYLALEYLIFSFALWEVDPALWDQDFRSLFGLVAVFGVLIGAGVGAFSALTGYIKNRVEQMIEEDDL